MIKIWKEICGLVVQPAGENSEQKIQTLMKGIAGLRENFAALQNREPTLVNQQFQIEEE